MNQTRGTRLPTKAHRIVRHRHPLTTVAVVMTAGLALAVAGCTGTPTPTPSDTASDQATSYSPHTDADTDKDTTSLEDAAATAHGLTDGSTVISIETENGGVHWEVEVATSDGAEYVTLVNMNDGSVARGPDQKKTDAEDLAENRALLSAAKLDAAEAATIMRKQVPGGTLTKLELDDIRGATVWEGDIHDSSGVKHEVKIDAASGSVVANKTGPPSD